MSIERDTYFQDYAEQVWRDLIEIIGEPLTNSAANFEEFHRENNKIKLIIAQNTYDLMQQATLSISDQQTRQGGVTLHPNAMLRVVPGVLLNK